MDKTDARIVALLQDNARLKNAELARQLGLAQSTVLERIRRLEEQGIIKGYMAVVDPRKLGLTVQALISVSLKSHEAESILQFEDSIRKLPHVRACLHLTGRFDYILHVAVKDLDQLRSLIKNHIAALPGFGRSETFVIFADIKDYQGYPVDADNYIESDNHQATDSGKPTTFKRLKAVKGG
ncbi:MAG: Lrp/AsnC family transcriptional regulator [Thermodesulfobacteriota bacterium]